MEEEVPKLQPNYSKEDYNNVPVYYCKDCLSLLIHQYDIHTDYCAKCGNTDIGVTTIDKWEKMYFDKYGKKSI